jgi:hypothetical protein
MCISIQINVHIYIYIYIYTYIFLFVSFIYMHIHISIRIPLDAYVHIQYTPYNRFSDDDHAKLQYHNLINNMLKFKILFIKIVFTI